MATRPGRNIEAYLPLHPADYAVLLALARADRHGYGLLQDIATRAGGGVRLDAGNLYRRLRRMLEAAWVERLDAAPDASDDSRRRFYRLTDLGRDVAAAETARLRRVVDSLPARALSGEARS